MQPGLLQHTLVDKAEHQHRAQVQSVQLSFFLRASSSRALICDKNTKKLTLFCICFVQSSLAQHPVTTVSLKATATNWQLPIAFTALPLGHICTALRLLRRLLNSEKEILNFLIEISLRGKAHSTTAFELLFKCLHLALTTALKSCVTSD